MILVRSALVRIARSATAGPAAAQTWRALLLLLFAAVSYLALSPHPPKGLDTGWDKANHVLAFTALALCAHLSRPASRHARRLLPVALLAYGGLIECVQSVVPGRSAEWGDLLADAAGIAAGVALAAAVLRLAAAAQAPGR